MFTMPYVNFSALSMSKERSSPSPIKSEKGLSLKKDDVIAVKLSNGKTITGLFKGYWGEDDDRGIFIDDYVISDNDIISIKNNVDEYYYNKLDESVENIHSEMIKEMAMKETGAKTIIAYHGSVDEDLKVEISTLKDYNRAFYLTDNKELAKKFAYREVFGDGLYDDEIPVLYTFRLTFKNPYYLTQEEFDSEGQDSNIDVQKWIDSEYDGIIFKGEDSSSTYYICFREGTFEMIDKEILPIDNELDESYESFEDLTKWNRIAGFYHWDTGKFELFPRTSEEISTEDDEINDYIHNVQSTDEFTESKIVRFGIEDIPGEGVVCYIEGDTRKNVERCYYAILDKYSMDIDIVKYELSYYVGNDQRMIVYDSHGNQMMESNNNSDETLLEDVRPQYLYHATTIESAKQILKENKLSANTTQWLLLDKKFVCGVSLARNKYASHDFVLNDYDNNRWDSIENNGYILFILDYDKLKQTNKIIPYTYFYNTSGEYTFPKEEYEEFVVGDIKNLTKYIVGVEHYNLYGKLIKKLK